MNIRTLNHSIRRSLFTACCLKFEIRVSSPHISIDCHRDPVPDNTAILLLGNAGATFRQLEKHSELYNSLGYRTLACILPRVYVFHYDIPSTVKFCKQVNMVTTLASNIDNSCSYIRSIKS